MPSRRPFRIRRWLAAVLAIALWIAVSAGWSWLLVTRAFERDMNARLLALAHSIAALAQSQLAQLPAPAATQTRPALDLENQPQLQADVEDAARADRDLAYAMIWDPQGEVKAHSNAARRGTELPPETWPVLDPTQSSRISTLEGSELTQTLAVGPVAEVTVPLALDGKTIAYVSTAYLQSWLHNEFWRAQKGLLVWSAAATLAGVLLILLAVHFAMENLEKRRREIQQTALARTSLLTERGMLASVLAHEVRSPLTALRFNLHSLRSLVNARSSDIDRQVELTDRCEREIRRLDGMLNDFLQRTQVIGPVESASVNAVVREAIEFLRPALERDNIRISIHLDESDPLVHVHPDELRQVILNLAANGQDAMAKSKTPGTLAVSTLVETPEFSPSPASAASAPLAPAAATPSNSPAPSSTVTILIRDAGTGIPPELHERIFEPFFSTKPNGSGLGLALVRRVVSGAGGVVFCESVVGEGTTFRIVLPRAQASGSPALQAGQGYAHIHREEPALEIDQSPEIVIDRAAERARNDGLDSNDE